MSIERTLRVLNIVSYRQLKFYESKGYGNMVRLLQDMAFIYDEDNN